MTIKYEIAQLKKYEINQIFDVRKSMEKAVDLCRILYSESFYTYQTRGHLPKCSHMYIFIRFRL